MEEMRKEPPIAQCAFSWGRVFRLYDDYLEVNGTRYALSKLTYMRPIYQQVLGVSSVRLVMLFGNKKVVLRGIAAIAEANKAIDYLTSQYLSLQSSPGAADEDTNCSLPQERITTDNDEINQKITVESINASEPQPTSEAIAEPEQWPQASEHRDEREARTESTSVLKGDVLVEAQEDDLHHAQNVYLQERAQATTAKVETPNWQRFRQDQRARRQQRLHVAHSLREHGFDVEKLTHQLKEDALVEIIVPLRLLPGEHAYYSTDATLCDEPIGNALRYTYPARDHGTLILTSKRLIYIGRKSQIILDYARLTHISRLRGAIALQAEHWYRREIFEVRRSLECIIHLESILRRFQREQAFEATTNSYVYGRARRESSNGLEVKTTLLSMRTLHTAKVIDSMDR
jgi:hypothetical protein